MDLICSGDFGYDTRTVPLSYKSTVLLIYVVSQVLSFTERGDLALKLL